MFAHFHIFKSFLLMYCGFAVLFGLQSYAAFKDLLDCFMQFLAVLAMQLCTSVSMHVRVCGLGMH